MNPPKISTSPAVHSTTSDAPIRPVAGSSRRSVRGAVRPRKLTTNGGQPVRLDAHSPDAGGNRAEQGAPAERVESPRELDRAAMEAMLVAVERARLKAVLHQTEAERLEDCSDEGDECYFVEEVGGQE